MLSPPWASAKATDQSFLLCSLNSVASSLLHTRTGFINVMAAGLVNLESVVQDFDPPDSIPRNHSSSFFVDSHITDFASSWRTILRALFLPTNALPMNSFSDRPLSQRRRADKFSNDDTSMIDAGIQAFYRKGDTWS
jgi:hypothetical protein